MKKVFAVALGVLTAIGGFVDIGDLVTNALVGARFGLGLAWVTILGVVGICVFAEMSGRVAAVSGRATFDIVRERLGPRVGLLNLAAALLGFFAATFGAACETGLSLGYSISQYFGWQWGKYVPPFRAARFHTVLLVSTILAVGTLLTTVDPIMLTEYSVVFSALALPLTYLPILIIANDRAYMGQHTNGRVANTLGSIFLLIIVVTAVAAIPLMILTKAGQ